MDLSTHALQRCAQRGIRREDIELVLCYGTYKYGANAHFIFLRKKDLPRELNKSYGRRLEGITLVVASDREIIITVYKNPNAFSCLKRRFRS